MPDGQRGGDRPDHRLPVARVAVDVPLAHLDRPFDYLVPPAMDASAQPGVRVRVRFAGRLVDGFVLARAEPADPGRRLTELTAVVSPERVLAPEVAELARAVADRYAGTAADVLRLAVPRRHAGVEAEPAAAPAVESTAPPVEPSMASWGEPPAEPTVAPGADLRATGAGSGAPMPGSGWHRYRGGDRWLVGLRDLPPPVPSGVEWSGASDRAEAGSSHPHPSDRADPADPSVRTGGSGGARSAAAEPPRVVWTALPGDDWPIRVAEAVAATVAVGRGALAVVPDRRDLARLDAALTWVLGPGRHVALSAELGPRERYRRFLRLSRRQVRVAAGTRAAMFAPVPDLGLVVVWDDGDDLHAEPRAPYPHVRDVLLLRAHRSGAAALLGGHAVSAEAALLVRSGWAQPVAADRALVRAAAPAVSAVSDADLPRDPLARAARLPHSAFEAARRSLADGRPVLVSVPRAGYTPGLCCALCRRPARCAACGGPLQQQDVGRVPSCGWCGRPVTDWVCPFDRQSRVRAVVVGADRTAEELGRAFPGVRVRTSGGGEGRRVVSDVPDRPALVVATPGAEPLVAGSAPGRREATRATRDAPGAASGAASGSGAAAPDRGAAGTGAGGAPEPVGYGAVLLLDGWLPLSRPDLRAGEEAVRRWLGAAALAVPAPSGGHVVLVADAALAAVQAVIRWDPAGFAGRELDERVALHFPPAARTVSVTGPPDAIAELVGLVELPPDAEVLGPVAVSPQRPRRPARTESADGRRPALEAVEPEPVRVLLRTPLAHAPALVAAVKAATGVRSARKSPGAVRVQVDPLEVG